jgi:peptidyl-dipeptidase A
VNHRRSALALAGLLALVGSPALYSQAKPAGTKPPTVAEAETFMQRAEAELLELSNRQQRAEWVAENFITDDTEEITAEAGKDLAVAVQRLATRARRYEKLKLSPELSRKFLLLKLSLAAPPPADSAKAAELSRIQASMQGDYGKGTYCRPSRAEAGKQECLQIGALSKILVDSHDPAELLDAWQGWHKISPPMRQRYARYVELANQGARELGFADAGAMWRSNYDMPPDEFARETDRLWNQVRPLYLQLHAYVRSRLAERYGKDVVPTDGLIPAHLLGNMWAQEWGNIYSLVAPANTAPAYDLTELLQKKNTDAIGMVRYGEGFFVSLGFDSLPGTFWERSLFVKPRDRDVVCHASAWDVDNDNDLRIKVCITPTAEDFVTVHHELGHNFYQRAYRTQPFLFRNSANDGFHEAVGDAIALAITPAYLQQVGLLQEIPSAASDTAQLLRQALDKVAFLPFGLLIDRWRWGVFSGEIKPADYNKAWWDLRAKYQGLSAPLPRTENDFDPGAKYHVPANVPYTRYFLARLLQFQFYRTLCREAGFTGPLYRCTFFGNKAAGAKLDKMLSAGASRPWQDILYDMTGEREMDGSAMIEYFAPLQKWLEEQNKGKKVGW